MDLGLKGRTAIVCASSSGLGFACALSLGHAGVSLIMNGRNTARLEDAAEQIRREAKAKVTTVAADLKEEKGRTALLEACPKPDILITNNGGPPLLDYQYIGRAEILEAMEGNFVAPIELIKQVISAMANRGFGRIVNISSIAARMPVAGLETSSAARSALAAYCATLARRFVGRGVTINHLLPGYFATDRMLALASTKATRDGMSGKDALAAFEAQIPAGRLGVPDDFGATAAFLCSARAGYITGHSLLIDGGLHASVH